MARCCCLVEWYNPQCSHSASLIVWHYTWGKHVQFIELGNVALYKHLLVTCKLSTVDHHQQ